MNFNKIIIIFLFCVSISKINAQKLELGKVSIAELEQKVHPKDSSAVAAILFKKGNVRFEYNGERGFEMITEVQTKIKIYKKEGYDWANQAIRYYLEGSSKENLSFSDAVTYNLVNGKIEKTKLKSDGEFDEKINRYWGRKKITMANVKEGSIIEFQYVIKSANFGQLKEWDFQSGIPVNYSEYKTYVPEYFTYNTNQKGFIFPKVLKELRDRKVDYTYFTKTVPGINGNTPERVNSSLNFKENITIYQTENVPALKEEAFVNNIDNYTSSISHELSSIKYPNDPFQNFATDWETVTKKIYDNEDFGPELNKTGYFEQDINAVITGLVSRDEKIAAIFNFVKSKVKWNDYYGYSCNDGVKTAYKNKTGNVAEINLMLTAMLRYAGISANPVLVSTRSNGIAIFPNRGAYNYVIAAVEIENDLILLDATDKFSTPNILPLRDLNWFGRLIRKEGSSVEVDLMPKLVSKEVTNMSLVLTSDGTINGKLRRQISDHSALSFRQRYAGLTSDSYLEQLENRNNNIEIADYKRDNELDLYKPIVETYSFKDTKNIENIGDKIYISPLLSLNMTENPFKQEIREYPIDFGYPMQDKYNIAIEIPQGYAVETLPAQVSLATDNNIGAFKYVISNSGNKIQVQIVVDINEPIVSAEYYEQLKAFFQKMVDKQAEKIVLKKA